MRRNETLKNILTSELFSANAYLERVLHALISFKDFGTNDEVLRELNKLHFDLNEIIESNVLKDQFIDKLSLELSSKEITQELKANYEFMNALIQIKKDDKATAKEITNYINTIYAYARTFHLICQELAYVDIALPRPALASAINIEDLPKEKLEKEVVEKEEFTPFSLGHLTLVHSDDEFERGEEEYIEFDEDDYEEGDFIPTKVPLYQLSEEEVFLNSKNKSKVLGLGEKKEEKYEDFVQLGHKAVFGKDYENALYNFYQAAEVQETGEIYTLIAWVYTLQGKNELAKSHCLKAIKKDPDYGPPYNDLGSLLLNEGHIKESLKWFELAKKAPKYQNREYPYINAGRAHMMTKNMDLAITEFEKAIKLAPFNEDLKATIERVKQSYLEKEMTGDKEDESLSRLLEDDDSHT
ncbi:hypothetical protein HBN50_04645 [Halobacteriovorax sp. GB3]|uniref:hypothetical protein n=1 Tax=Halobacteriovorax sp. GB3 TaxID=2719615 RepID=UPI00235E280E|nr:hypothetical protein [Halobacteriovorax sp. GB3]MDD0852372.1 hypothetical protein [Halobacteriovorax sp. GB3]